jgi:hypothetical protein
MTQHKLRRAYVSLLANSERLPVTAEKTNVQSSGQNKGLASWLSNFVV